MCQFGNGKFDFEDFRRSRGTSEEELLNCIFDLLEGSARKWFRAMCRTRPFNNWEDFCGRFRMDFEPIHMSDSLMDEIRNRVQKPDESVVKYFITMENLFLRLPRALSTDDMISILRRNMLQHISQGLAAYDFSDLENFKQACRRFERNYGQTRTHRTQNTTPDQSHRYQANNRNNNWNYQSQRYPQQSNNRNDNRRNDSYHRPNNSNLTNPQNRNQQQAIPNDSRPKINCIVIPDHGDFNSKYKRSS